METNQPVDCSNASIEELRYAFNNRIPITGIKYLASHYGAHLDEIFSKHMLRTTRQGKELFPDIDKAEFGPLSTTVLRQNNMLGEEGFFLALHEGILLLGVGGGLFDEHTDRKSNLSCTELVARHLDLRKEKSDRKMYGPLIDYINFEDGNGDDIIAILNKAEPTRKLLPAESDACLKLKIGNTARHVKVSWKAAGNDLDEIAKIYTATFEFFRVEIEAVKLFIKAADAYDEAPKFLIPLLIPGQDQKLVILDIEDKDNTPFFSEVIRNKWRGTQNEKLGIIFLHKPNGQFALLPDQRYIKPAEMREVIKILRDQVIYKTKRDRVDWKEMGKDEIAEAVPELHIFDKTGVISNGSLVDPDVPGLIGKVLTIETIIEALKVGLGEFRFPKAFRKDCGAGLCAKSKCFLYGCGLERCHTVRKNTLVQSNVIAML